METDTVIVRLLPATAAESTFADAFFCTCNTCTAISQLHPSRERKLPRFSPFFRGYQQFSSNSHGGNGNASNGNDDQQPKQTFSDIPTTVVHFDAVADDAPNTRRNTLLLAQLEALHDHCLPVAYDDKFYMWLKHGMNHVVILAMQKLVERAAADEQQVNTNVNGDDDHDDHDDDQHQHIRKRRSDGSSSNLDDTKEMARLRAQLNSLMFSKKKQQQNNNSNRWTKPFFPAVTGLRMTRGEDYQPPTGTDTKFDYLIHHGLIDPVDASPCSHGFCHLRGVVVVRIVPPPKGAPFIAPLLAGRGAVTPPKSREALGALAYIATLGVRDDSRGQGLATELVVRSLEESSGLVPVDDHVSPPARQEHLFRCNRVFLHCLETNAAALSLYQRKLGFVATNRLTDYYIIDGEWSDAVVLTRPIEAAEPSARAATGKSDIDLDEDEKEDLELHRMASDSASYDPPSSASAAPLHHHHALTGSAGVAMQQLTPQQQRQMTMQHQSHTNQQQQQQQSRNDDSDDDDNEQERFSWKLEAVRIAALMAPAAVAAAMLL